jgi:hypothetical protein
VETLIHKARQIGYTSMLGMLRVDANVADLIAKTFKVIDVEGSERDFKANTAQLAFESRAGRYRRNIVMKSRQQGMTTWIIARHLLFCLSGPSHVSVGMFMGAEAAEHASIIAARMLDSAGVRFTRSGRQVNIGNGSCYQPLSAQTGRSRALSAINNLHVSELSRWSEQWADNLEEMRAMLAPISEEVVESSPYAVGDLFYREWESAGERGVIRHFFPWWMGDKSEAVEEAIKSTLTDEECGLIVREGVTLKQITQRRSRQQRDPQSKLEYQYLEEVPWNKTKGKP